MSARTRHSVVVLFVALLLGGCAGSPPPEEASPEASSMSRGAEIWAGTCNRCHALRPPAEFSAQDWPVVVSHMRTKAELTREQAEAVATYLRRVTGEEPS